MKDNRTNGHLHKRTDPLIDFGYQPDPQLAQRLMEDLILDLNGPVIMAKRVNSAEVPRKIRFKERPEFQTLLRKLVSKWMSSSDITEFMNSEINLARYAPRFKGHFYPGPGLRGYLLPAGDSPRADNRDVKIRAYHSVMTLVTNQYWAQLGSPCPECEDFFLKKRKLQKYCTRACSSKATAMSTMKEKRLKEQEDKIRSANTLIAQWAQQGSKTDWKRWVKARGGFTLHWLTHAVNTGKIHAPHAN